jgi:hypothetical protein
MRRTRVTANMHHRLYRVVKTYIWNDYFVMTGVTINSLVTVDDVIVQGAGFEPCDT